MNRNNPARRCRNKLLFLFAPADFIVYPPKPFSSCCKYSQLYLLLPFIPFQSYQNILSTRWTLPDAKVCHPTLKLGLKCISFGFFLLRRVIVKKNRLQKSGWWQVNCTV